MEVRLEVALGPPLVAYLTSLGAAVTEIQPLAMRSLLRLRSGAEGL